MSRQDIGVIRQMWLDRGEDMPFALCFGVPPVTIMVNETDFIGALTGNLVEVTKCETNDIIVPAGAEIVFGGVVSTTETASEGPMAEYHGMIFPGECKPCPVFRLDAITHRKYPILPICVTRRALEESQTVWGLTQAAEVSTICQDAGLPIKMVWNPFETHCLWFILQVNRNELRKLNTNMEEFGTKVGRLVFGSKPGYYIPSLYLVVDAIDPTHFKDVIWVGTTPCQPQTNEFFIDEYLNISLIPYISHGLKVGRNHFKVVKCCPGVWI